MSDQLLQISLPALTKRSLKIRSAETGLPMRAIVLRALAGVGIQVPDKELQERRRPG